MRNRTRGERRYRARTFLAQRVDWLAQLIASPETTERKKSFLHEELDAIQLLLGENARLDSVEAGLEAARPILEALGTAEAEEALALFPVPEWRGIDPNDPVNAMASANPDNHRPLCDSVRRYGSRDLRCSRREGHRGDSLHKVGAYTWDDAGAFYCRGELRKVEVGA